jgi:hypothetical protein
VLVLDSAHGTIRDNDVVGNNVGMLVLSLDVTARSSYWEIFGNHVVANNAVADPAALSKISGGGIALTGADHVTVAHNVITGNRPDGFSTYSGGVLFVTLPGTSHAAPIPAHANTVTHNLITGNSPVDIGHDVLSTGNTAVDNAGHPTTGTIAPAVR